MHKKRIQKYQDPSSGLVKDIISSAGKFLSSDSLVKDSSIFKNNAQGLMDLGLNLSEMAIGSILPKAQDISRGESAFSSGTDMFAKIAMQTGNVPLMVASAALKGLDLANRYFGQSTKKQGTRDIFTGPYKTLINQGAGKKQTLLGTWGGRKKKLNNLTNAYDKYNLSANYTSYLGDQNMRSALNMQNVLEQKNLNALNGGIDSRILVAKGGQELSPAYLSKLVKKAKPKKSNVIPEGVLHARKNNMPDGLSDDVTKKGIPVVTFKEGGDVIQHAEIEENEIIFTKEVTDKLEQFYKDYKNADNQEEKEKIAIECGKYLTNEIMLNTDDKTGLLEEVK